MARCFLVRHGETAWNAEGRVQGHLDSPLTDIGRRGASCLAARLHSVSFNAGYCSDLGRARNTMDAIISGTTTSVKFLTDLREKAYGSWEGVTFQEVRNRYFDEYQRLFEDDVDFAPSGGESDVDLVQRTKRFVDKVNHTHSEDEDILIVAHGGSLRAVLVNVLELPMESLWHFRLDNCSLSIVTTHTNDTSVHLWNDTSHVSQNG